MKKCFLAVLVPLLILGAVYAGGRRNETDAELLGRHAATDHDEAGHRHDGPGAVHDDPNRPDESHAYMPTPHDGVFYCLPFPPCEMWGFEIDVVGDTATIDGEPFVWDPHGGGSWNPLAGGHPVYSFWTMGRSGPEWVRFDGGSSKRGSW